MTRLKMPPTPASSTEIKGQDHSHQLSTLQVSFELPPSAMGQNAKSQLSTSGSKESLVSPSSKTTSYPVQPSETVKSRRRSSTAQKETFALPPPPTRSRRIIQMKPRPQEEPAEQTTPDKTTSTTGTGKNASATGSKKKQPSATSAAGRKIARKTAHSLIERRRRSKMNEEFAVLKGLIPACTGEMHKLAILQASIEYVRYLEDCINKLKSQHDDQSTPAPPQFRLPSNTHDYEMDDKEEDEEEGQEDVEMTGSEAPSPVYAQTPSRSNQSSISPALVAQDARGRQQSYSSVSTEYRHYSYSGPSNTSPAFGPQGYSQRVGTTSASHSTLTSPALRPQQEIDQEASAALLMLTVDRRGMTNNGSGRGMSVRDLLSS
ncbi:uncharacterized protein F4822DRAFT_92410 [Hypoxylon trugodes]|uniref:uncharacterized protein n=1 Tax=Hypoxylon trugodes TaxID=326681 RepID=UPI002198AC63|nr:uncharacterized protein F4822DRAFT_92410 [Hypoxylon trugodes]KAI1383103.1 hypothetical protein F4822DRAFT_92410 [Hypoxylon trugodes]